MFMTIREFEKHKDGLVYMSAIQSLRNLDRIKSRRLRRRIKKKLRNTIKEITND